MVNTFIYHITAIIWSLETCEQGNQVGKMLRGKGIKKRETNEETTGVGLDRASRSRSKGPSFVPFVFNESMLI